MPLLEEESTLQQTVNLRAAHPISFRFVLMRCIFWILGTLLVAGGAATIEYYLPIMDQRMGVERFIGAAARFGLYIVTFGLLLKLLYEITYYVLYYYAVELEHLVISKGVLLKTRSSFPMAKINDVHLSRSWMELIFGLYTLNVMTPSPVAYLGQIDGLKQTTAVALQNHLLALVETTLPKLNERAAGSVVGVAAVPNEEATQLHRPPAGDRGHSPSPPGR